MEKTFTEKLIALQQAVKATKSQKNTFGNYNYRSAEQILQATKPELAKLGLLLTIDDAIVEIGGRVYVQAIARITDGESHADTTAFAREPEDKKGMDASQVTGAASSYARKYALCGLLLLDDNKDADTNEYQLIAGLKAAQASKTLEELQDVWNNYQNLQKDKTFVACVNDVKKEFTTPKEKAE